MNLSGSLAVPFLFIAFGWFLYALAHATAQNQFHKAQEPKVSPADREAAKQDLLEALAAIDDKADNTLDLVMALGTRTDELEHKITRIQALQSPKRSARK